MESKLTKGPWRLDQRAPQVIEDLKGRKIASSSIFYNGKEETEVENAANAQLIAAAPQLLEALQDSNELLGYISASLPDGKVLETVNNALLINKAAITAALGKGGDEA